MIKGIYASGNNLHYKVKNLDIVANNLANLNSTGFKRELPFSEIIERFKDENIKQLTDFKQGTLLSTSNPLDLGINGDAYFSLETPDGEEYTRRGQFKIDNDGFLVNEQGFKVLGKSGPVNLGDTQLDEDRTISVSKNGELKVGDRVIDELKIVKFDDSQPLVRKEGLNFALQTGMYVEAEQSTYEIQQGFIEESNVNPVLEMQDMISINKEFETTQKVINALDQSLEKAIEAGKV